MIQDEELIPDSHERTESTLVKIPLYRTGLPVKASQAGFFVGVAIDSVEEVTHMEGSAELVSQVLVLPEGFHLSAPGFQQGASLVVA